MRFFSCLLLFPLLLLGCGPSGPVVIPPAAKLEAFSPGLHKTSAEVPEVGPVKYAVRVPDNYDPAAPCPLVVLLHYGYEGSKPDPHTGGDMISIFESGVSDWNAIVIAPDVVGGDWTSRKNEKAAIWLARSAMETYAIDKKRVMLSGFSMGGEGAWFLGSKHQDLFTAVVPVAAPPAGKDDVQWSVPVCVIHSQTDQVIPLPTAKRHFEQVKGRAAKIDFIEVQNVDHYEAPSYAPFLKQATTWAWGEAPTEDAIPVPGG